MGNGYREASGRIPKLSRRLTAVASLVTPGNSVCDVGCDHGFVSVYLAASGKSPHVIAMDVRKGPLAAAKRHIQEYHVEELIETRLSDGLSMMGQGEAQTLILAGMGGALMLRILETFPEKTGSFEELILQPQSEVASFRKRIRELGIGITDEKMILEDGKYYPMMKAVQDTECANRASGLPLALQDCYGPILLERRDPVLLQYLQRERCVIDGILAKKAGLKEWIKQGELNDMALHILQ